MKAGELKQLVAALDDEIVVKIVVEDPLDPVEQDAFFKHISDNDGEGVVIV
ncbi:MAG: hypothetical protein IID61_14050 [SAR324 cluster bacterium]|nr:hypothetical protein [SAR324 cluster bacterium]